MTQEQFEAATLHQQSQMLDLLRQIHAQAARAGAGDPGNAEGPTLTVTGGTVSPADLAKALFTRKDAAKKENGPTLVVTDDIEPVKNPVGEVKTEEATPDMGCDGGEPKLFRRPPKSMCDNPADKFTNRDRIRKALYGGDKCESPRPDSKPMCGPGPAMTFERVMAVLKGEREYQRKRWGRRNRIHAAMRLDEFAEPRHDIGSYIVFIDHYLSEAKKLLATTSGTDDAMDAMRKVAALCVALGETHGYPSRNPHVTVKNGHDGLAA